MTTGQWPAFFMKKKMKIKGLKQNSFKKYIMLYFIFKNKLTLGLFVFGLLFMSCQKSSE